MISIEKISQFFTLFLLFIPVVVFLIFLTSFHTSLQASPYRLLFPSLNISSHLLMRRRLFLKTVVFVNHVVLVLLSQKIYTHLHHSLLFHQLTATCLHIILFNDRLNKTFFFISFFIFSLTSFCHNLFTCHIFIFFLTLLRITFLIQLKEILAKLCLGRNISVR